MCLGPAAGDVADIQNDLKNNQSPLHIVQVDNFSKEGAGFVSVIFDN